MTFYKFVLYAAVLVTALSLWNLWQQEHRPSTTVNPLNQATTPVSSYPGVPTVVPSDTATVPPVANTVDPTQYITVTTDTVQYVIDRRGGNVIGSALLHYPQDLESPQTPFVLLSEHPRYISQSGLTGTQGPDTPAGPAVYTSAQDQYRLVDTDDHMTVDLHWANSTGLEVTKRYVFYRGRYQATVDFIIHNGSTQPWQVYPYAQLQRAKPAKKSNVLSDRSFTGVAVSSPAHHYKKIRFSKLRKKPLKETIRDGWLAMTQHYFLSAWVPPAGQAYDYYSSCDHHAVCVAGLVGTALNIAPQQTVKTGFTLYSGPAVTSQLQTVAPYLSMTVDYGWLWFISSALFWVMKHLYDLLGNWGWAIVVLTLLIKLSFYGLSAKSYTSMAHMRRLQPRMQQLKEQFGDDKQKLSQAMIEMYRTEKVNPLSGCLPVIVQIPVFIALYYMIIESIELRQAPFIFWIRDLSVADPWYILPVTMGLLMLLQQRLNPPISDPIQRKVMLLFPAVFTLFCLAFPAGLVLYWITNTALSMLQQWWIMRTIT